MEKVTAGEAPQRLKSEPCEEHQPSASTEPSDVPRGSANRKERKRTLTMNSAFAELRDHIPNVPPDTKLSKIKTLRLAISYIKFLTEILEESNDGKPGRSNNNFVVDLALQSEGREKRKRENLVSWLFYVGKLKQNLRNAGSVESLGAITAYRLYCLSQTSSSSQDASQRKRGRTGWPQYVWAMELRNWYSTVNVANLHVEVSRLTLAIHLSSKQTTTNKFRGDL